MTVPLHLTPLMVVIVAVGVFLGAVMDAIAGGGGIIMVPTYLLAGLPMHLALGTSKMGSVIGSIASAGRFIKSGYINWRLALPGAALAVIGAALGTQLQLMIDERILQYLLLIVLPVVAVIVLRQRTFPEEPGQIEPGKQMLIVLGVSAVVGVYDGFYGPGTGTFLLLLFTRWGKMDVRTAAGTVKAVNFASNLGSLMTALLHGQVFWQLGLIAAAVSFAGHFLGAGMAIRDGSKIIRPTVLIVLALLAAKVLWGLV